MYHCRLRFVFIGHECEAFEVIRQAEPLERFSHEFMSSGDRSANPDVFVLNVSDLEENEVLDVVEYHFAADSACILILKKEQFAAVMREIPEDTELWTVPASKEELTFRFGRWQKAQKTEKDKWLLKQYLDVTINSSPAMVWYKNKYGIHIKVNDSFCQIVGKSREDIEGKDHCAVWDATPEDAEVCNVSDANVMLTGGTCVTEERVRSGSVTRLFTTYKSPLYDVDGSVMGTVGLGVDITMERAFEEEIEKKNHSLETIFTSLDCGILCHSLDGSRVISINKAALEILGYESKEDMEASGFSFVADSVLDVDKPVLRRRILSLVNVGDITDVEYRVRHDNGDIRHVMGSIKLMEENGELYYQRFLLDNTAKKMEEAKILKDALAQANRASQAKSNFLFNISHDIRTPMNAVVGFTTLAISHMDEPEKAREYLDKIMTSSKHMLGIINDVLDMSRIESGKAHLEPAPASLMEIMSDIMSVFDDETASRDQTFEIATSGIQNDNIICDKLRLKQIFINLLSNAVKYTPSGGHVSLTALQKEGATDSTGIYEFIVTDDGIGMDADFIEHIYEPFEREKNTTISGIQGTGLGMAITKNIVDMMDGHINIKSAPGEGTTIELSFIFPFADDTDLKREAKGYQAAFTGPDQALGGRILLVEDNEINREIAEEILTDAGFEVDTAANGQIAVDTIKNSEPGYYKLVLMDVQMPVMNGYDATREIRKLPDPGHSNIPIFAMTANAFDEDKRDAYAAGMNGHIAKPIDVDKLLAILARNM